MKHERPIQFTNAEIVDLDPFHQQLRQLSDFLWNDPRPHAEGKFHMSTVCQDWEVGKEDPTEALSRCGTSACACGWAEVLFDEARATNSERYFPTFYDKSKDLIGLYPTTWMFGALWDFVDPSPFGASFRIDFYLKHWRDRDGLFDGLLGSIGDTRRLKDRHYPADAFWMAEAA